MKNSAKISEMLKIDMEALTASTTGGTTSGLYDMSQYDKAFIGVNIGIRPAAIATLSTIWVDLVETSAVTAAPTSAAGSKTGIVIGAAGNTDISATAAAKALIFLAGTHATTADIFYVGLGTNVVQFTFSSVTTLTSASTAWSSTACYFGAGSAVETTANTGETGVIDSIRRALESTRIAIGGPNIYKFTTPSTDTLYAEVVNSTKGCFKFLNTMTTDVVAAFPAQLAAGFNIRADQMTSTASKRFIGVKMTSSAQAVGVGVTVVRAGGRFSPCMPDNFVGKLSS